MWTHMNRPSASPVPLCNKSSRAGQRGASILVLTCGSTGDADDAADFDG